MITVQEVLEQLALTGDFDLERLPEVKATLTAAALESSTPWYIHGLVGLSAWIAAVCFIAFLAITEIITSETGATIAGVIFGVAAVALKRLAPRSIFWGQLALALSLAGQALFIFGIGTQLDSVAATAFIIVILEIVLIAIYPDVLHRFLSTLIICGAAVALCYDWEIQNAIHVLILLLAAATLFIWENEAYLTTSRWAELYRPVGYGVTVALLALLSLSVTDDTEIERWWLSAVGLLALLLVLEYLILTESGLNLRDPVVLWLAGGTLTLIWPAWQTPGILGAILVLLVGFRCGNRLLLGLAAIFLAFFVIIFYYNLELTLLAKSLMLMGSGAIILALRYFLLHFWQRREVAA